VCVRACAQNFGVLKGNGLRGCVVGLVPYLVKQEQWTKESCAQDVFFTMKA
jgi:hypothetical protein